MTKKQPMSRWLGSTFATPLLSWMAWALQSFAYEAERKVAFPRSGPSPQNTSDAEIDEMLEQLSGSTDTWARTPCSERAALLHRCFAGLQESAPAFVEASLNLKGEWATAGEEWMSLLPIAMGLRDLIDAMDAEGVPEVVDGRPGPDDRLIVDVFPSGLTSLLFAGITAEVWVQSRKPTTQGRLYRDKIGVAREDITGGGVQLVLAGGNQVSLAILDALDAMFVHDRVVIMKINPVSNGWGPPTEAVLAPLIEAGFVRVVYGGKEQGEYLSKHPMVGSVHLTGSAAVFDAIVWGAPDAPKEGTPPCSKPVFGELGCVTPYLIVPGEWSEEDYEYHAAEIASGIVMNAGHNCMACELVVVEKSWPGRPKLMAALKKRLDALPQRATWYPASGDKAEAFRQRFKPSELGVAAESSDGRKTVPWMVAEGLTPDTADLSSEHWCGVIQEVVLEADGAADFMRRAAKLANTRCWGSLSCSVWVHPDTVAALPEETEAMVAALKYGMVTLNAVSSPGFCMTKVPWGAYPGNDVRDIGSGNCFVHNFSMLDHPEKAVVRAAWRQVPKPIWWPDNTSVKHLGPHLLSYFARPNLVDLNMIALQASLSR